jgi:hypothetical protein
MSIIRNTLAVIGAITVTRVVVRGYFKYICKPLAELIAEAADVELERRERTAFTEDAPKAG